METIDQAIQHAMESLQVAYQNLKTSNRPWAAFELGKATGYIMVAAELLDREGRHA
jgi:hypothetical protein